MLMTLESQEARQMKGIQQEIGLTDALNRIGQSDSSDDEKVGTGQNYVEIVGAEK